MGSKNKTLCRNPFYRCRSSKESSNIWKAFSFQFTKGSTGLKKPSKEGEGPELAVPEAFTAPRPERARGRNSVPDPRRGSRSWLGFQILVWVPDLSWCSRSQAGLWAVGERPCDRSHHGASQPLLETGRGRGRAFKLFLVQVTKYPLTVTEAIWPFTALLNLEVSGLRLREAA